MFSTTKKRLSSLKINKKNLVNCADLSISFSEMINNLCGCDSYVSFPILTSHSAELEPGRNTKVNNATQRTRAMQCTITASPSSPFCVRLRFVAASRTTEIEMLSFVKCAYTTTSVHCGLLFLEIPFYARFE